MYGKNPKKSSLKPKNLLLTPTEVVFNAKSLLKQGMQKKKRE